MRLLNALAFASGVLALAIGPVQPLADQQTVQGDATDASLNLENAVVPVSDKLTPRDEIVSSSELEKREPGTSATVRFPGGPNAANPSAVIIAGVSISFIMAYRYIERQGTRVRDYYVRRIGYHNENAGRIAIQAVANGVEMLNQHIESERQGLMDPPEGANNFLLVVTPLSNDEL
ncbi:hypothetical protein E4U32_006277 [Claviceps aff. humidiphila group G2b]|nr:hypothetical protein E4U32_006277 [Claviceps aff. humidiphila group G2b]